MWQKRPYPSERAYRDFTEPEQLFVLNIVIERPGVYLEEIKKELDKFISVNVSISAVCNFLRKSRFTKQTLCTITTQQDTYLREKYIINLHCTIIIIYGSTMDINNVLL